MPQFIDLYANYTWWEQPYNTTPTLSILGCAITTSYLHVHVHNVRYVYNMQVSAGLLREVEWDKWINAPGMPPWKPE